MEQRCIGFHRQWEITFQQGQAVLYPILRSKPCLRNFGKMVLFIFRDHSCPLRSLRRSPKRVPTTTGLSKYQSQCIHVACPCNARFCGITRVSYDTPWAPNVEPKQKLKRTYLGVPCWEPWFAVFLLFRSSTIPKRKSMERYLMKTTHSRTHEKQTANNMLIKAVFRDYTWN